MGRFYDIHCHIFNISHVPMKTVLKRNGWKFWLFLKNIKITKKDDYLRKYVRTCEKKVINILEQLVTEIRACNYTKNKEIVLTPLLLYFQKEDPIKCLKDEIKDIKNAIKIFLNRNKGVYIYPFVGIDPLCDDALDLVRKYVVSVDRAQPGDFIGVKIYPPLNFDIEYKGATDKIYNFFDYCSKESIPITTHCAGGGLVSDTINKSKAKRFSYPLQWKNILKKFPDLKVNFAHMGDFNCKWIEGIESLMLQYLNVYSDISYSIIRVPDIVYLLPPNWLQRRVSESILECKFKKLRGFLNKEIVKDRILFGSDYYMSLLECGSYSEIIEKVKNGIGEDNLIKISEENPEKFLGFSMSHKDNSTVLTTEVFTSKYKRNPNTLEKSK
ncbi:MAG: amidohydrolase family protein [Chitinispirillaceae bacterium]|nr:amidohydrolase family protein [Chitinispirillaceae bacterium]